jgi:separase
LSLINTSLIGISNAYWTLSKQHPEVTSKPSLAVEGMWASVRCLEGLDMGVRRAGQFMSKCQKLAQFLQSLKQFSEAAAVYSTVLKASVGCLTAVAEAMRFTNALQAWAANEEAGHLWQAIDSLLQLDAREHTGLPQSVSYYDCTELSTMERAVLLERQMFLDEKWQKSKTLKERAKHIQTAILPILLQIYDESQHPVRRARICLRILRTSIDYPGELNADVISAAKQCADMVSPQAIGLDIELLPMWDNIRCSITAVKTMLENNDEEDIYNTMLTGWEMVLKASQTTEDLQQHVDDVESWKDQLIMLVDYLHFHSMFLLELRAVAMLIRLSELEGTKDISNLSAFRIRVGSLLLQLGLTSEAGVQLMKARDGGRDPSTLSWGVLVTLETTLSTYFSELGDASKR